MEVTVNGEARAVATGSSVADLVAALGFTPKQVAVERNKLIVRRADHAETALQPGDQLEVVTFFGGGEGRTIVSRAAAAHDQDVTIVDEPLVLGPHTFHSRLFLGTGKYPDMESMVAWRVGAT